ncbi:hypothetical protein EPIR_3793 [Erwinia piriflorinigrans CFBP 5888]|uniref:Uncharacterized protein n=1 Tax=Erwinia piriflorinigrans CFBP 5888 TaxID=1161919 RepID=V5ZDJ1_9GAMM|nr:hypothetical protein EPIR_3793 [Erwinia piriflorinigrans CFBP 5888]
MVNQIYPITKKSPITAKSASIFTIAESKYRFYL